VSGSAGTLARRLGTGDAVIIGLGSMMGAGVFAAFGPAAIAPPHSTAQPQARATRLSTRMIGFIN